MVEHYLAELPESKASAAVREIYDDIRETLGLPVVNLLYRHLAVEPGRLESTWAELRPVLKDPATHALAGPSPPGARRRWRWFAARARRGRDRRGGARARRGDFQYERANARNLVALRVLLGDRTVRRRCPRVGLPLGGGAPDGRPRSSLARPRPLHEVSARDAEASRSWSRASALRARAAARVDRGAFPADRRRARRLAAPVREHACVLAAWSRRSDRSMTRSAGGPRAL